MLSEPEMHSTDLVILSETERSEARRRQAEGPLRHLIDHQGPREF